jgi:hypothetical protein
MPGHEGRRLLRVQSKLGLVARARLRDHDSGGHRRRSPRPKESAAPATRSTGFGQSARQAGPRWGEAMCLASAAECSRPASGRARSPARASPRSRRATAGGPPRARTASALPLRVREPRDEARHRVEALLDADGPWPEYVPTHTTEGAETRTGAAASILGGSSATLSRWTSPRASSRRRSAPYSGGAAPPYRGAR